MMESPILALVLEGARTPSPETATHGATDPSKAMPGTIRATTP